MDVKNVKDGADWFSVLQSTEKSQTAVMTLDPGQSSSEQPESHSRSDQILVVLDGKLLAEVGSEKRTLEKWDILMIPAATPHKLTNQGDGKCVTFNTYSPPEY